MLMRNTAPIVLFAYNRVDHLKLTLSSLKKNQLAQESDLFVYSDGVRNEKDIEHVQNVRQLLGEIVGFRNVSIIEREKNYGLSQNIIRGVTEVIDRFGKAIVIEDDHETHPNFLVFMNNALDYYQNNEEVYSVTGYNYPNNILKIPKSYKYSTYFSYRNSSWTWGTWKDRWDTIDWEVKEYSKFVNNESWRKNFNKLSSNSTNMLISQMEGRLDSWSIRFSFSQFNNKGVTLYPVNSLVNNIGVDGSGVHHGKTNRFINDLDDNVLLKYKNNAFIDRPFVDKVIQKKYAKINKRSLLKRIIKRIFANLYK
jgi:GT2 family glycosyltransferase